MVRSDCEGFVRASPHGSFLVRDSVLKSKFVLVINDSGTIVNFQIKVSDLYQGLYAFAGGSFSSMDDIIELVRTKPVSLPAAFY